MLCFFFYYYDQFFLFLRLVSGKKKLKDGKTMADYNIKNNGKIKCVVKLMNVTFFFSCLLQNVEAQIFFAQKGIPFQVGTKCVEDVLKHKRCSFRSSPTKLRCLESFFYTET